MTVTFIIATTGRYTLRRTLGSIETRPGDEILLVSDGVKVDDRRVTHIQCPRGNDWGHTERNFATPLARGRFIAHIDDDDWYASGTRALMEDAMEKNPDRPTIFRMRFPNGITLWQNKELRCGNMGTPCFFLPNKPEMFGTWGSYVGGDFAFLQTCRWQPDEYVWRPEVIAHLGHNIGE